MSLYIVLRQMRQRAINESVSIVLCASSNQQQCIADSDNARNWSAGWISFVDLNGDRQRNADNEAIIYLQQAYSDSRLYFNRGRRLSFDYNGEINQAGSFLICDREPTSNNRRAIIMNKVGRPYRSDKTSQGKMITCR